MHQINLALSPGPLLNLLSGSLVNPRFFGLFYTLKGLSCWSPFEPGSFELPSKEDSYSHLGFCSFSVWILVFLQGQLFHRLWLWSAGNIQFICYLGSSGFKVGLGYWSPLLNLSDWTWSLEVHWVRIFTQFCKFQVSIWFCFLLTVLDLAISVTLPTNWVCFWIRWMLLLTALGLLQLHQCRHLSNFMPSFD